MIHLTYELTQALFILNSKLFKNNHFLVIRLI